MNDLELEGLQLWADLAATHGNWPLCLIFKWRMLSHYQGGVGLAWPVGLERDHRIKEAA